MEWSLGVGLCLYMSAGLVCIVLGYHDEHKIFMMATIVGSGGPGLFRVLRSSREFFTHRLFRPMDFT